MIHELISGIIHDLMICTTVMRNSEHEIKHAQVVCCLLYLPLLDVASVTLYAHASFNRHKACAD